MFIMDGRSRDAGRTIFPVGMSYKVAAPTVANAFDCMYFVVVQACDGLVLI